MTHSDRTTEVIENQRGPSLNSGISGNWLGILFRIDSPSFFWDCSRCKGR
jgi:hypothetical protein